MQRTEKTEKSGKTHEEQIKELKKIICDIKFGMLCTTETDGSLRSRPMATQQIEEDGSVYFFLYGHSPKCGEIKHDSHVNISFAEPKKNQYASLSGKGTVIKDKSKMEELWNPLYKTWFPKGLDEPDIALLKVTIDKAEYWDYSSGTAVRLVGFAKSLLTGKSGENLGTNEKVQAPFIGEKKDIPTA